MSVSEELVMYAGIFVYGVSYLFTKSTEYAIFLTIAAGILSVPVMLVGYAIAHQVSEHGSLLSWVKHCAIWLLKTLAVIFLSTPLVLIAIDSAIKGVDTFNRLQEEWAYNGLCYKTIVMSVGMSCMFFSFFYTAKQLMKFMD